MIFSKIYAVIREDKKFLAISSVIIGIIAFVYIHGMRILDFQYDAWLLSGGDLAQHYLGWTFFRNSAWHFPLGLMDGIFYPDLVSVVYTDSIPLFAIIFKIFDGVLPGTFQYFGFWGLLCYVLQGLSSAFLIRYFVKNNIVCLLGSVFFILSSTLMWRLYIHTALAGQWLILLAMLLFLYRNKLTYRLKNILWGGIAILCVSIHAYFVPMTFVFLLVACIMAYLENRNFRQMFYSLACYIVSVVLTLYLLGAFATGKVPTASGLGVFCSNLNSFFSPWGTSAFLPNLNSQPSMLQIEGFAYLGAGMLLLVIVSIVIIFLRQNRVRYFYKIYRVDIIGMGLISFIFIALASLPVLTFGSEILFTVEYPSFINKILSVFRANGRFIWVAMYCVMLFSLIICSKSFKMKFVIMILTLAVIIQVADFGDTIMARHDKYSTMVVAPSFSDNISLVIGEDVRHITFLPKTESDQNPNLYALAAYAQQRKLTISDFHFARRPNDEALNKRIKCKIKEIEDNAVSTNEVVVINTPMFFSDVKSTLNFYMIDGIIFGSYSDKEELAKYRYNGPDKINILDLGMRVSRGNDENKHFTILAGGILFGPYTSIGKGNYVVEISGDYLDQMEYDVSYDGGKSLLPITELERTNNKIVYEIFTNDMLHNVEFRIKNNSAVSGEVTGMWLKRSAGSRKDKGV